MFSIGDEVEIIKASSNGWIGKKAIIVDIVFSGHYELNIGQGTWMGSCLKKVVA